VNKAIIVGGYCASGKSVFSRKLSALLNIPCFNKDVIKEVLGDGFGPEHNMVFLKGSSATFLLMLYIAEQYLQVENPFIIESNFKAKEIEQIKTLLNKYNCDCLTYIFKGDFDVLFDRYMKRDIAEKRHWVHNTLDENNDTFRDEHLEYGIGNTGIGQIINVDTTSFASVNYDDLFSAAKNFMNDA
jgi:predicted kinase